MVNITPLSFEEKTNLKDALAYLDDYIQRGTFEYDPNLAKCHMYIEKLRKKNQKEANEIVQEYMTKNGGK